MLQGHKLAPISISVPLQPSTLLASWFSDISFPRNISSLNPFVLNRIFLYPLKTPEWTSICWKSALKTSPAPMYFVARERDEMVAFLVRNTPSQKAFLSLIFDLEQVCLHGAKYLLVQLAIKLSERQVYIQVYIQKPISGQCSLLIPQKSIRKLSESKRFKKGNIGLKWITVTIISCKPKPAQSYR